MVSDGDKIEIGSPNIEKAIVEATTHYNDAEIIAEVSTDLGKAMPGLEISDIPENEKLQTRGW